MLYFWPKYTHNKIEYIPKIKIYTKEKKSAIKQTTLVREADSL